MASSASELARLEIAGVRYNVYQASFESVKPVDQWNRVTAYATKADARFVIEGTEETSKLFALFANSRKAFDATLVLNKANGEGELVREEFKTCYVTYYASKYNAVDSVPYTVEVVISARDTTIGEGVLQFDSKQV